MVGRNRCPRLVRVACNIERKKILSLCVYRCYSFFFFFFSILSWIVKDRKRENTKEAVEARICCRRKLAMHFYDFDHNFIDGIRSRRAEWKRRTHRESDGARDQIVWNNNIRQVLWISLASSWYQDSTVSAIFATWLPRGCDKVTSMKFCQFNISKWEWLKNEKKKRCKNIFKWFLWFANIINLRMNNRFPFSPKDLSWTFRFSSSL